MMRRAVDTRRRENFDRSRLDGIFRGVVEYNIDPLKLGRCKIRVPPLHGDDKAIPIEGLPWAWPITFSGGMQDFGGISVPPVGSTVWVQFEMGDSTAPIYSGGWFKFPIDPRLIGVKVDPTTGKTYPDRPVSMGGSGWTQGIGPEMIQEYLATPYEPTTTVVHKSVKGATILIEDRDGFERIRIIDRAGQEIRMDSPVDDENNASNTNRRKTRSASTGDALPYSSQNDLFAGGLASLEILSLNKSGLRIVSKENSDYIEIISKDDSSPASDSIGDNKIRLFMGSGSGYVELVGTKQGVDECLLRMDLNSGSVEIKGSKRMLLETQSLDIVSDQTSIKSDIDIRGDVSIRGDLSVSGELIGGITGGSS